MRDTSRFVVTGLKTFEDVGVRLQAKDFPDPWEDLKIRSPV